MQITAQEIATILDGSVEGDPSTIITGPGKIEEAIQGHITFLSNPKYEQYVYDTGASAILVSRDFAPSQPLKTTLIRVDDVYACLAILLDKFSRNSFGFEGISDDAVIDPTARIGSDVTIAPGAVIGANTIVGDRAVIFPQVYLGAGVTIGKNSILYAGVKIMHDCVIGNDCILQCNVVVGSDGFGFSPDDNRNYKKVPQIGNVIIEDHVEVGANTVIDRATMGSTVIREGVKLDNLIQIAHNVEIGKHTAIAAQTGISGSTKVGEHALIGGQVGMVGHITVADGALIQAQSGIASSIKEPNSKVYGSPAIDYGNYLRSYAYFKSLPDIVQKIRSLEKEIDRIKTENGT